MKTRERSRRKPLNRIAALSAVASFAACVALLSATEWAEHAQNQIKHRLFGRFVLQQVDWREVGDGNLKTRVSPDLLWKTSGLKKGTPLIDIDLKELETKLKSIPWIESVDIQKHLSVGIAVQYKTYKARAVVIQNRKPWLFSESGIAIAPIELGSSFPVDLPVLTGFQDSASALQWLDVLERFTESKELAGRVELHEASLVSHQNRHEIRALMEFKYRDQSVKANVIFLNTDMNGEVKTQEEIAKEISRLKQTVQYLINNNILVSSLDLRTGQKVVVNVGKRL